MLATGDDAEFMASPNIAADVEVADKTELYVKADGSFTPTACTICHRSTVICIQ